MEVFTHMSSLYGTQGISHYDTNGNRSGHSHTQSPECILLGFFGHGMSNSCMHPCVLPASPHDDLVGLGGRWHCQWVQPFSFYRYTSTEPADQLLCKLETKL